MISMKKPARSGQNTNEKTITTMTVLEQHYMETMPLYMKAISESMKMIAESLNRPQESEGTSENKKENK